MSGLLFPAFCFKSLPYPYSLALYFIGRPFDLLLTFCYRDLTLLSSLAFYHTGLLLIIFLAVKFLPNCQLPIVHFANFISLCASISPQWHDSNRNRLLPVLVHIHGGSNVVGQGSMFHPDPLAVLGHVIIVTVNYRLGVLGLHDNRLILLTTTVTTTTTTTQKQLQQKLLNNNYNKKDTAWENSQPLLLIYRDPGCSSCLENTTIG